MPKQPPERTRRDTGKREKMPQAKVGRRLEGSDEAAYREGGWSGVGWGPNEAARPEADWRAAHPYPGDPTGFAGSTPTTDDPAIMEFLRKLAEKK